MASIPSCNPSDLIAAAKCYDGCIPDGMKPAVKIYILAVMSGLDNLTPNELMDRAKCYDCTIPVGMLPYVEAYLTCQIPGA